ncbi:hypothetical protein Daus18300_004082, partial [Diaporthe australafricana]
CSSTALSRPTTDLECDDGVSPSDWTQPTGYCTDLDLHPLFSASSASDGDRASGWHELGLLEQLLDLQSWLQQFTLTDSSLADRLSKVLNKADALIRILNAVIGTEKAPSETGTSHSTAGNCSESEKQDLIVIHSLTCYYYLLAALRPMVESLVHSSSGRKDGSSTSTFPIKLGNFSLASQPEVNDQLTLHLIQILLQNMKNLVSTVASQQPQADNETEVTVPASKDAAIFVALQAMRLKEQSVFDLLQRPQPAPLHRERNMAQNSAGCSNKVTPGGQR